MTKTNVIVIGGGPAGLIAAGHSSLYGKDVLLIEKNKFLAKKLRITGKGRCNVTNASDISEILKNIPTNSKFMYSALNQFTSEDTQNFFKNLGVSLKVERGNRVFPTSDKAIDIVDGLINFAKNSNVNIIESEVKALILEDSKINGVLLVDGQKIYCDSIIIATGGLSYPLTGSTGDGYKFAKTLGHNIINPKAALVPIEIKEDLCKDAQGLALKNINLTVKNIQNDKIIFSEMGELLFTHFGVSGPLILSASCHMKDIQNNIYDMFIDLKPALSLEQLDNRILRDFKENLNKDLINSLGKLLPRKLIPIIIKNSDLPFEIKINQISKQMRQNLCYNIKNLRLTPIKFRSIDEAIITSGGVDVNQINPKTMESKIIKGLFFAGEVLDVDGYTGGFNLQIAFSTGYVAGINA